MPTHRRVKDLDYDADELDDDYSDEDVGEQETYTQEDRDNFASLTPVVRAGLEEEGLSASDKEIADALWHYYWDVGKSVGWLRGQKVGKGKGEGKVGEGKAKGKTKFDEAVEKKAGGAAASKPAQSKATKDLEKKTQNLKLDSEPPATAAAQPKVKSKNMDVPKLWAESASTRKPTVSFVVIGHVDHGKSTLMGRLLLDTGAVSQREIEKYRKEAAAMGKASFALAWVMDSTSDERERGVTVDIAQHHFSTDVADLTILDAPGHRDFVPSMLGGASMADLALLVVDANQLESGLKGQTREHCLLASAVGVKRMLVAVNKMDCTQPAWDETTFNSVRDQIHALLRETGFDPALATITPCSGLSGENVTSPPPSSGPTAWVAASTSSLVSALEISAAAQPAADSTLLSKSLRLQLADVFHSSANAQFAISVSGRLASGTVQPGEAVIILPSNERATVRSIEISDIQAPYAVAGQIATLHLDGDAESIDRNLRAGDTLCSAAMPGRVGQEFTAEVMAHETLLPSVVDVHLGRLHRAGRVVELVEVVGGKKRPRVVVEGKRARIRVKVEGEEGVCAEAGMGVVLRNGGRTVGSGLVEG